MKNTHLVWGIVLILLLILTMKLLEAIITRPIMQSSREANMPLWMLFPIIGCFSAGGE
jgi:predicted PurR-regulated permease PerM